MAVLGIQGFDKMLARVELYERACRKDIRDKAMEAAGEALKEALIAATPIGTQAHRDENGTVLRSPGNARKSVINYAAKMRTYGVTRRLIGYSKDAYYMLWVEKGHKLVRGGRLQRKGYKNQYGGKTHSQGGRGKVVGTVSGRKFMEAVFKANIGRAMERAEEVIRKYIQQGRAA